MTSDSNQELFLYCTDADLHGIKYVSNALFCIYSPMHACSWVFLARKIT